jgi:hypothetical protein
MLVITTRCDHPGCQGTVRFTHEGAGRAPRCRFGTCDACQRSYSLYGGQVNRLPDVPADMSAVDESPAAASRGLAG